MRESRTKHGLHECSLAWVLHDKSDYHSVTSASICNQNCKDPIWGEPIVDGLPVRSRCIPSSNPRNICAKRLNTCILEFGNSSISHFWCSTSREKTPKKIKRGLLLISHRARICRHRHLWPHSRVSLGKYVREGRVVSPISGVHAH